jgi:hypothetical protein
MVFLIVTVKLTNYSIKYTAEKHGIVGPSHLVFYSIQPYLSSNQKIFILKRWVWIRVESTS